jgi:hypothetical protein
MPEFPRVFYAAHLRRGERVLITTADSPDTIEEKQHMVDLLQERFPGVQFTLLCGVTGIAVHGGDNSDDDGGRGRRRSR